MSCLIIKFLAIHLTNQTNTNKSFYHKLLSLTKDRKNIDVHI